LIVAGAFYFIYNQLANNDKLDWVGYSQIQKKIQLQELVLYYCECIESLFEILKWQNLASYIKPISS
jgi:hypothetical protein